MAGARLHSLHGPGGAPWIGGGFEDTINEFLTYREALTLRLRLTLLAGRPDLPVHQEQRPAQEGLLQVEKTELVLASVSLRIPLLMSDLVYEVVPVRLRHLGNYIMAIAPRGPKLSSGEGVQSELKQVWFLCFTGGSKAFEDFLSELSGAGALRWDISTVLSQTWRLLHMGRCTVSSCWPRMSMSTKRGSKVALPALPACVAVKTLNVPAVQIEKEVTILRRCHQHPNINSFMGLFCLEDQSKLPCSAEGACWAMVSELESGNDLKSHVESKKYLEESAVNKAILGVSGAIAYLHKLKIIHRDVKPQHILLNYDGAGILTDFSSAVDVESPVATWSPLPDSDDIRAPEIATGNYNEMVDVFGLGVVLYFALSGNLPFSNPGTDTSKQAKVNYNLAALDRASNELRLLLRAALARDPSNRPTAKAAFVAAWHLATPEQRAMSMQSAVLLKDM